MVISWLSDTERRLTHAYFRAEAVLQSLGQDLFGDEAPNECGHDEWLLLLPSNDEEGRCRTQTKDKLVGKESVSVSAKRNERQLLNRRDKDLANVCPRRNVAKQVCPDGRCEGKGQTPSSGETLALDSAFNIQMVAKA